VWNQYRAEKKALDEAQKDFIRAQQKKQILEQKKVGMEAGTWVTATITTCSYCKMVVTKQRFKCIQCGMNMDSECLSIHHDPNHIVIMIPEGGVNFLSSEFPDPLGRTLEKAIEGPDDPKTTGVADLAALKLLLPSFECENPECDDGDCTESARCLSCNVHFCSACSDFHRKDHLQLYFRSTDSESLVMLLAMSFSVAQQRRKAGLVNGGAGMSPIAGLNTSAIGGNGETSPILNARTEDVAPTSSSFGVSESSNVLSPTQENRIVVSNSTQPTPPSDEGATVP